MKSSSGAVVLICFLVICCVPTIEAQRFQPEKKGKKWGIREKYVFQGNPIEKWSLKPVYDSILNYNYGFFKVYRNGKVGVTNGTEDGFLYALEYEEIRDCCIVKKNGKYGVYIGKWDLPNIFEDLKCASVKKNDNAKTGFYFAKKNGRWGVLDLIYSRDFSKVIRVDTLVFFKYQNIEVLEETLCIFTDLNGSKAKVPFRNGKFDFSDVVSIDSLIQVMPDVWKYRSSGRWAIGYKDKILTGYDFDDIRFNFPFIIFEKGKRSGASVLRDGMLFSVVPPEADSLVIQYHPQKLVKAFFGGNFRFYSEEGLKFPLNWDVVYFEYLRGNFGKVAIRNWKYGLVELSLGTEILPAVYNKISAVKGFEFLFLAEKENLQSVYSTERKKWVTGEHSSILTFGENKIGKSGNHYKVYDKNWNVVRSEVEFVDYMYSDKLYLLDKSKNYYEVPSLTKISDRSSVTFSSLEIPGGIIKEKLDGSFILKWKAGGEEKLTVIDLSKGIFRSEIDYIIIYDVVQYVEKQDPLTPYYKYYEVSGTRKEICRVKMEDGFTAGEAENIGSPQSPVMAMKLTKGTMTAILNLSAQIITPYFSNKINFAGNSAMISCNETEVRIQDFRENGNLLKVSEVCKVCSGVGRYETGRHSVSTPGKYVPEKTYTVSSPTLNNSVGTGYDGKLHSGYQDRTVTTGGYSLPGETHTVVDYADCQKCSKSGFIQYMMIFRDSRFVRQ